MVIHGGPQFKESQQFFWAIEPDSESESRKIILLLITEYLLSECGKKFEVF